MDDIEGERRALRLFEAMLDLDRGEREGWLSAHAAGDPVLIARVSSLVELHGTGALRTGGAMVDAEPPAPPERIGFYRITGPIGSGGMGAVYAARRERGDFEHEVAIKLIKPGLLSHRLARRFVRERQLLARFSHPNIARLFDGGETEDGQPFIVMERIDGVVLADWLERERPGRAQRLRLFLQLCDAMAHLHRHLVIHRDLTAGNVMVDREGNAKLIDFGIARPDGEELEEMPSGERRRWHQFTLTPGYAAPERLRGESATTLTDIYSAGRLLKLLIDKPRPAELQAISDKAMAAEPDARYATMEQLGEDVRRFIEGRTVAAMPPSRGYALRKWIGRNRTLAAALATLALAVVMGSAATAWKWREAEAARSEADSRLADTRDLANTLMFDAFDLVGRTGSNTQAKLLMARNAQNYLDRLAAGPGASFDSRFSAAEGYLRLGLVTGGTENANVGDLLPGLEYLERSRAMLSELFRERPGDQTRVALAESELALMQAKGRSFINTRQAIAHGWHARELISSLSSRSARNLALAGRIDRHLGDYLGCCSDDPARGSAVIGEGLRRIDDAPAGLRRDFGVRRARNDLLNLSAGFRIFLGEYGDGPPIFRQALASQRALMEQSGHPDDRELEATIATNLARTLLRMGRVAEADRVIAPTHVRAIEEYRVDSRNNTLKRRLAMINLARAWIAAELGDAAGARTYLRDGLAFARGADWPEGLEDVPSLNYANRLQEASEAYWALGDTAGACRVASQAVAMYRAYERKLDLPATTLRYRLARITGRMHGCPGR